MLKQLLSDNRIFGAIVCVIVFIGGGLLYLQFVQRQAARDTQRTQESVEQRDNRQTRETIPQTAEGGHYHDDGTYHAQPHETESPTASTNPSSPGATTPTNITQRMWTGQPLRESVSPDMLTPEQRKARAAKIQRLNAEIQAVTRLNQARINQWSKHHREIRELLRKRKAIQTERDALPVEADRSDEEETRYNALFKQSIELSNRTTEMLARSEEFQKEVATLTEKEDTLKAERAALLANRRVTSEASEHQRTGQSPDGRCPKIHTFF